MKKKILNQSFVVGFLMALLVFPWNVSAGGIKTKDRPKKCGGYHNGSYSLKCEKEKKKFVNRKQNMKNPFRGFTKTGGKPKKQGSMPHAQ